MGPGGLDRHHPAPGLGKLSPPGRCWRLNKLQSHSVLQMVQTELRKFMLTDL